LKYDGAMIVVSVTIVISAFGVGKIGNQIVVGFKVLAKHVFGVGVQVATLHIVMNSWCNNNKTSRSKRTHCFAMNAMFRYI